MLHMTIIIFRWKVLFFKYNKQPQIFGLAQELISTFRLKVFCKVICFNIDAFGTHVLRSNIFSRNFLFHAYLDFLERHI